MRLELASSAIKAVATSIIKPTMVSSEILTIIEKQKAACLQEVMGNMGIQKSWGGYNISSDFRTKLVSEATQAIETALTHAIQPAVERASKEVASRVEAMMLNKVHTEVNKLVADALKKAVDGALSLKAKD